MPAARLRACHDTQYRPRLHARRGSTPFRLAPRAAAGPNRGRKHLAQREKMTQARKGPGRLPRRPSFPEGRSQEDS
jgi:hypothetical protein